MGSLSCNSHNRFVLHFVCVAVLLAATLAQSQTIASASNLLLPSNIVSDSAGNIYVAERAGHDVRKIDGTGQITVIAGTGTQGFDGDGKAATAALLDSPQGLAVGGGKLYIADSHNHRVRAVDLASGVITTVAGNSSIGSSGDGGSAVNASLDLPLALALDGQGNLYIADARGHRIRRVAANGVITTVAGAGVQGFGGDSGQAITALVDQPGGLTIDASGNLYLADTHNHRVRRIDAVTGAITTIAGTGDKGFSGDQAAGAGARLALPRGLSVDPKGNVYLADSANHRIRRVDAISGVITTVAGEGTQGFAGDGGSPLAASLDSPGDVTLASSGAVAIADTGNARVRQVTGSSITTLGGEGVRTPTQITISGPATATYGTGRLTATLNSTSATGNVTFTDSVGVTTSVLSSTPVQAGVVALDLSLLSVGQHNITANYSGDRTHMDGQSQVFAVAISPAPLTVTVSPSSMVYGDAVPQLTASLGGVLPRDASSVTASVSTVVQALSPVGAYPIAVTLSGPAAANYVVSGSPTLTIVAAATTTTLNVSATELVNGNTVASGQAVLITAHVSSSTTGGPSGLVTIFDGVQVVGAARVGTSGDAAITTASMAQGTHTLTASYAGDNNFRGSVSSPRLITVSAPGGSNSADFTMVASSTTQSIVAGGNASFSFVVTPQSGLASQVALAASGLPGLAAASFSPAYVPPGAGTTTVTMTIATQRAAVFDGSGSAIFAVMAMPLLAGTMFRKRTTKILRLVAASGIAVLLVSLSGCGDRINRAASTTSAAKSYTVTVTGTATGSTSAAIEHAVIVTLVVTPAS